MTPQNLPLEDDELMVRVAVELLLVVLGKLEATQLVETGTKEIKFFNT